MSHRPVTNRALLALASAATACSTHAPRAESAAALPSASTAASLRTTAARADRWQILLNDGRYLYDLHLVAAHGDTLVATQPQRDTLDVPLADIDELRLVQASARPVGTARNTFNGLVGADDAVYKFARLAPAERRHVVQVALRTRPRTATNAP